MLKEDHEGSWLVGWLVGWLQGRSNSLLVSYPMKLWYCPACVTHIQWDKYDAARMTNYYLIIRYCCTIFGHDGHPIHTHY